MKCLLDTCVLSELVKPAPEPSVTLWLSEQVEHDLFVSSMSLAELHRGVSQLPKSKRRTELADWLVKMEAGFEDRVLPLDQAAAPVWASLVVHTGKAGKTMAAFDSIIAATAMRHELCLVTRNTRDFESAGLKLLNPWKLTPK